MKKLYFLLFTFLISASSLAQATDLFFSMYAEGSSNNKFLQIYNGTGMSVNLDDYAFPNVSNAPAVVGEYEYWNTFPSGVTLADGDVFVIAHGSSDPAILAVADMTFNFLSNGNDGFALVANDGVWTDDGDGNIEAGEMTGFTILDFLGSWDADPGSGWPVGDDNNGTQDQTLTRKSSICSPNPIPLDSFGSDAATSEWIVGPIDSGWAELGSYTGCVTTPTVTISTPGDGSTVASGTTSIDVVFSAENAPGGSTFDITISIDAGPPATFSDVSSPFTITPTVDGESYEVTVELVDGSILASDTTNFEISFPCDLQIGTITSTCDAITSGLDTYTTTLEFTGGGTSQYSIDTEGNGTVSGDDPTSSATGTITISGVDEAINFIVTFTGDPANSTCDFTRNITSPVCLGSVTCANVGDIIITEVMQDPNAVGDSTGEYFEVYNTTASPIDMQGWIIKDEASAGEEFTISFLTVPANGYAVFGLNADMGTNGGVVVDYEYSGVSLGNSSDGLIIDCTGTIIDQVIWDNGATFPDPTGASMELSTTALDAVSNDDGANWGTAVTSFGSGDLGTPGAANDFTLSTTQFDTIKFSLYPNPTNTGFVTITSNNNEAIQAQVFDVLGKQVLNNTISNNRLNVSSLNAGLYIVKLTQNNASVTKKLIIK